MGTIVRMDMVRISYPHLFQPHAVNVGDDAKFGASFLIPKNHPTVAALVQAFDAEKTAKFGPGVGVVKNTLYDGDAHPSYVGKPECAGHYVLSSSAKVDRPPLVVDQNRQKIMAGTIYAGCYVNMEVGVYANDRGVFAGLNGVQFAAEGEPLGNQRSVDDMFGAPAGAPPPIAPGVQGVPAGNTYAQPVPAQPVYAPPVAGVPPAAAPVAAQPAGVPPVGMPDFFR